MAKRRKRRHPVSPPPRPAKPPEQPQVGRRPSSPGFLLLVGLLWIGCGVVALVRLSASWKLIPGIVFIGVGVYFLRGAATSVVRRTPP
jgi:hypothetical protein